MHYWVYIARPDGTFPTVGTDGRLSIPGNRYHSRATLIRYGIRPRMGDARHARVDVVSGENKYGAVTSTFYVNAPDAPMGIVEYTDPTGNILYDAYGPMVTDIDKATRFISVEAANRAALNRTGQGTAFWNSERESRDNARKQYERWTFRVIPAK